MIDDDFRSLVLQEQLLAEIWRSGDLFSTAGGEANLHDDPEDSSRRLIRQVLGAVSEYERAMIALRLRRGRAAKAARGGFAYGSPAFGHRAAGRALVLDEREQAAIARARELQAAGPRCAGSGRPPRPRVTGPSGGSTGIRQPWLGCSGAPADRSGGAAGDLTAPRQPRMGPAGCGSSARCRTFVVDGAASRPSCTAWAQASIGWSSRGVAPPGPPAQPVGPG